MATEKEIKKELLRQLEKDLPEAGKRKEYTAEDIILKNKSQLKKLKRIALISWIITAAYALAMHNLQVYLFKDSRMNLLTSDEYWIVRYIDIGMVVLIIATLLISYLVYHKSKTLTMLQICARLANIEECLKKISQEK